MRMLAALLYLPSCTYLLLLGNAAFALPPSSLREISGGETMTTLGGARTPPRALQLTPCSAHRHLSWGRSPYRAPYRGSGSSLCPAPMPQGVSYVHIRPGMYIRYTCLAEAFIWLHLHAPPLYVVVVHAACRPSQAILEALGGRSMQDRANELRRIPLLGCEYPREWSWATSWTGLTLLLGEPMVPWK